MGGCSGEACKHRDDSPTDQYPGDPNTRTDFVHQQVAGYFKNEVAKEEDSRDQSKLLAADSQFLVHGQSGESNIDSVNERDHEENEHERDNPRPQPANCCGFDCAWSKGWTGAHAAPPRRIGTV